MNDNEVKSLPKIEEIIAEPVDTRRLYNVLASFKAPANATLSLAATSKEHAAELAKEQLNVAGYTDHTIHDVYLLEDVLRKDREMIESFQVVDSTAKEVVN